jgi:murein L,D-transpeptidase YcbB/YkuD
VRETLASLRPPSLAYAALRTELARVRAVLAAPPSTEPAPETSGAAPPLDRAALEGRARTIAVNLERWRWLPDQLGARHLLVNLAAFRAELVEPGRAPLVMRAIVGRTYRRTPVFSSRATHVVLSPYWNVPPGIARKDILPLVRKDPGYLARMNMHVFVGWGAAAREVDPATMDWSTMTGARFNAKYWFRADPGALNPLGGVKIVFPNPYAVYVHGTSTPALFDRDVRTFSSGCIRVDDALGLAERLLGAPRWSRDEIERVIAGGVERTIALVEPVPVHVLYWTAWMDERGEVRVEEDVYARDGALATAIEASPSPRAGVCPGP